MRIRSRTTAVHYAQGLLMGGADVIPGVSGGTMALIVGIYERLIRSISAAAGAPFALARGGGEAARRRLGEVEWSLVLPLGAGIVSAIAVGAVVIPPLLEAFPAQSSALFFGLITASLAVPLRRMSGVGGQEVALMAVAALGAFLVVGLPEREVADPTLMRVFLSAAVAICAMILPGVSGSYLLVVMGIYAPTLEALRGLDVAYIGVFVLGAVIGIGAFAKVLVALLAAHHDRTMAALVGIMAGALRALWPWLDADRGLQAPPGDAGHVALVVAWAAAGFVLVTVLVRLGARREARVEASGRRSGP